MNAGRELDALVAEKVMGATVWHAGNGNAAAIIGGSVVHWGTWVDTGRWYARDDDPYARQVERIPCYSTDIAAAWQVVEHLGTSSGLVLELHNDGNVGPEWYARFCKPGDTSGMLLIEGSTAPLAICRAALVTVGQA